jgi:protein required for attachment to host cells
MLIKPTAKCLPKTLEGWLDMEKTPERSSVEPVDWHHIEERRFAKRVAADMEDVVRGRKVPALVVVAPPKTLADLRQALHADVQARIIAEINKDLTKYPIGDIERHLIDA